MDAVSLLCVAMAVYHEARGEPLWGQRAVAYVITNRSEHHEFPDTPCDVVTEKGQFAFAWDYPTETGAWESAVLVSAQVLSKTVPDPTEGALCFARTEQPSPCYRFQQSVEIAEHKFWRP